MKKNTNWKGGGGHNGTSIYCCLIMAAGTVRTHKKANWHLVVHSHTPWIMKQNTTNHTTNTFYKTPNRSIKYFRILRLLQQLLQLNPYIDKRLTPYTFDNRMYITGLRWLKHFLIWQQADTYLQEVSALIYLQVLCSPHTSYTYNATFTLWHSDINTTY